MEENSAFVAELNKITLKHGLSNYNQFNIFPVMFKMHDEKYLHSRFIAFLLDTNASHNQGTVFLELFSKVFKLPAFSLIDVTVNPNEEDRSEKHNIDILIKNSKKQAIIIENKFFAGDQTIHEEERYLDNIYLKYQIPRYYYRIALDPEADPHEVVAIVYLTINGKDPEEVSEFPNEVKKVLLKRDHLSDIAEWLDLCLAYLKEDSDLRRSISQYSQARKAFLNDVGLALDLKELTANYFDEAIVFWLSKSNEFQYEMIKKQFIHVKWHTVQEFYVELAKTIEERLEVEVKEVDKEKITAVTHRNSKSLTAITFEYNDKMYYVCNDGNGFSVGIVSGEVNKEFVVIQGMSIYAYFDFSKREVFELIKPENSQKLIDEIFIELKGFVKY